MFVLPSSENTRSVVDQNDKATLKALSKIQKDCRVYMKVQDDMVEIYARQISHLSAGAQALRSFIAVNSRGPGCKIYPLMHRCPQVPDPSIFLHPTEELGYVRFPGAWRGVAMPQDSSTPGVKRNLDARTPLSSRDLMKAIEVLGQSIRPVPGQLRMRIHFGILHATHKKIGVDWYTTTATFAAFLDTVAARGTLNMHHRYDWTYLFHLQEKVDQLTWHRLGGPDLTLRIREQIYITETTLEPTMQKFTPASATVIYLRDVKPKYCLVFFAGNRRIELDVQYDPDPELPNLRPTAAAPRIYESHARFSAAEIAVACPDQNFDWHMAVEGDIASEEYGTQEVHDVIALAKRIEFNKPPENSFEFPAFTVPFGAISAAKVDRVACKVTWVFEYVQKPLFVEVSVYHDWHEVIQGFRDAGSSRLRLDTAQEPMPVKSCGVNLYGQEWDSKMQTMDPASGTFDQDFLALFSDGSSSEGVDGLLQEIEYLLGLLSDQAGRV